MAAGQRAFNGESAEIVRDAILHHPQTPVRDLNSKLPPKLEEIINKAWKRPRAALPICGGDARKPEGIEA